MTDEEGPGEIETFAPPSGSGITVERGDDGVRVTLPRLYGRGDVIVAVVLAAVALWIGLWVDAISGGPGAGAVARLAMAGVAALFAALAGSEAVAILTRRVIEDAGDRIVLSRQVGVRRVLRKRLPKSRIRAVGRVWREDELGAVEIRVGERTHRVGRRLDGPALEWLEDVLRGMVRR